jgi:hypothetical protein
MGARFSPCSASRAALACTSRHRARCVCPQHLQLLVVSCELSRVLWVLRADVVRELHGDRRSRHASRLLCLLRLPFRYPFLLACCLSDHPSLYSAATLLFLCGLVPAQARRRTRSTRSACRAPWGVTRPERARSPVPIVRQVGQHTLPATLPLLNSSRWGACVRWWLQALHRAACRLRARRAHRAHSVAPAPRR